jgi:hypothetical protein
MAGAMLLCAASMADLRTLCCALRAIPAKALWYTDPLRAGL